MIREENAVITNILLIPEILQIVGRHHVSHLIYGIVFDRHP